MQDAHTRTSPSPRSQRRGPLGAFILLALGLFFLLNNLIGNLDHWFLLALGLGFLGAHLSGRAMPVPAGILVGLGVGVALRDLGPRSFQGLFFQVFPLGLGFVLVWLLDRRHRWAFWPAGVLIVVGLLSLVAEVPEVQRLWAQAGRFWPLALVLVGAWLLWRQYQTRR